MAAAKARTNWFAVVVSTIVVVALVGVGALVLWLNNRAAEPGVAPSSAIINAETGAISFGEGPDTVATYVDFLCPACANFESQFGGPLRQAADAGQITLEVHPIAIMNHAAQGTNYSSRAAGAMYCVASEAPDAALDFMDVMFQNQASAVSMDDAQIAAVAEQVGAGAASDCIADRTYAKFVDDVTPKTPAGPNGIGTPTVVINGERIDNSVIGQELAALLG